MRPRGAALAVEAFEAVALPVVDLAAAVSRGRHLPVRASRVRDGMAAECDGAVGDLVPVGVGERLAPAGVGEVAGVRAGDGGAAGERRALA
jgi:hypothetical protein